VAQNRPKFIRRHGRIIPIREKRKDAAAVGVGAAGAAVSLDAARTKTVYKTKNLTIERKQFSILPMESLVSKRPALGTALFAKNKKGRRVGRMHFTVQDQEGVIDWLSVKKSERGKGISKKLAKQAAVEMRAKGGKEIFTHVVHPRSAALLEGEKGVKSTYFRVYRTTKKSGSFMNEIGKKEALAKAGQWKGKPGKFSIKEAPKLIKDQLQYTLASAKRKSKWDYAGPTIYRQVKLPKLMRRQIKPFRTRGNKLALGLGAVTALTSVAYLFRRKKS
jgi:predicted GNAT family acetyltransferase